MRAIITLVFALTLVSCGPPRFEHPGHGRSDRDESSSQGDGGVSSSDTMSVGSVVRDAIAGM